MFRSLLPLMTAVACLAMGAAAPAAEESKPSFSLDGWVPAAELDKALAFAKEKDRGLVFMYLPAVPSKDHVALAEEWARDQSLSAMLRVIVHTGSKGQFEKVRTSVNDGATESPRLYFATPDLVITGYVTPREARRLRKVAGLAATIDRWRRGVNDDLVKADALAEQGRFGAAVKLVSKLASEDASYTQAVIHTWESLPPPATKKDDKAKDNKKKDPPKEEPRQADKPDRRTEGWYFPGVAEARTTDYRAKAAQRLAAAREQVEAGKIAEARQTLAPLAADGAGFDEQAEARKLLAELAADADQPAAPPADDAPPAEEPSE
mgnify:CR=1 FL=1